MPGAVNVPFGSLKYLDKSIQTSDGQGLNRIKDKEELAAIFKAAGVDLGEFSNNRLVATCGSGMTASMVYLGLHISGHKNISLYDGSWTEYADENKKLPYVNKGVRKNV